MKKIFFFLATALISVNSFGQTVDNAGMETWRTGTAGLLPPTPIAAPTQWHGYDSLALAYSFIIGGTNFNRQLFQESSFVNSGTGAAKIMTAMQGDLGFFPGTLSNAKATVDITAIGGGGSTADAIQLVGGTTVTVQPTTVSAWVAYFPGIDTATGLMGGLDEGSLTAQAIATIGGADSIVGAGLATIAASSSYTQVTANLTYLTTDYPVHTLRIIFTSSTDLSASLDSSTLYVDDVTYTGVPNPAPPAGIKGAQAQNEPVLVFPNPASGTIYFSSPANSTYNCTLSSISGQVVRATALAGNSQLEVSDLPAGIYIYSITDKSGIAVQRGNISIY